jgi:hypothetical protein
LRQIEGADEGDIDTLKSGNIAATSSILDALPFRSRGPR